MRPCPPVNSERLTAAPEDRSGLEFRTGRGQRGGAFVFAIGFDGPVASADRIPVNNQTPSGHVEYPIVGNPGAAYRPAFVARSKRSEESATSTTSNKSPG